MITCMVGFGERCLGEWLRLGYRSGAFSLARRQEAWISWRWVWSVAWCLVRNLVRPCWDRYLMISWMISDDQTSDYIFYFHNFLIVLPIHITKLWDFSINHSDFKSDYSFHMNKGWRHKHKLRLEANYTYNISLLLEIFTMENMK